MFINSFSPLSYHAKYPSLLSTKCPFFGFALIAGLSRTPPVRRKSSTSDISIAVALAPPPKMDIIACRHLLEYVVEEFVESLSQLITESCNGGGMPVLSCQNRLILRWLIHSFNSRPTFLACERNQCIAVLIFLYNNREAIETVSPTSFASVISCHDLFLDLYFDWWLYISQSRSYISEGG